MPTLFPLAGPAQAAGGGEHGGGRGAEAEDRAAPEGEEESAAGQQHDAPAALFQVRRLFILHVVYFLLWVESHAFLNMCFS